MFFDEGEVDELGAGIQDQLEENRNTVKEKLMTIHQRLDALNLEDNLQQLKERTGHTIRVHRNIFAWFNTFSVKYSFTMRNKD